MRLFTVSKTWQIRPPHIGVKIKRTSNLYISSFLNIFKVKNVWEDIKSLAENMWIQQK